MNIVINGLAQHRSIVAGPLILHVEQSCLLGFFALIVVVTARGGFCCQTHIFASGHIFFYEGDNINETFQSVDLEVIVSQFNELKNHVLYWQVR